MAKRFWEIDFLRGAAIMMMIAFHTILSLDHYGKFSGDVNSTAIMLFGRSIGIIFLFLVGISLTISYARGKKGSEKYLKRGLWIFFLGLLITLMSWLYDPQMTIWFGVLHLIGISIIIGYFFLKLDKVTTFMAGSMVCVVGLLLQNVSFDFPWLLWLGFKPWYFMTYDYFPLLPFLGLVLIGMSVGKKFYEKKRNFSLPELGEKQIVKQVCFLGRHSLVIYLLHVPILLAVLYLLN